MKKVAFIFRKNSLFSAFINVIIVAFEKAGYEVLCKTFPADADVPKEQALIWLNECTAELIFTDKTCKKLYYNENKQFKKLENAKSLDAIFDEPLEKFTHMPKGETNFETGLRFLASHLDLTNIKEIYLVKKNLADHCILLPEGSKIEDWKGKHDELSAINAEKIQDIFRKVFPGIEKITLGEFVKGVTGQQEDVLFVLDRHHEVARYIMTEMKPDDFNAKVKSKLLILPAVSHIQWAEDFGLKFATEKLLTNESVLEGFKEFLN